MLLAALLIVSVLRHPSAETLSAGEHDILLCLDCLDGFGWEAEPEPVSVEESTLSTQLSEGYLSLQREAGFDLSDDMGKPLPGTPLPSRTTPPERPAFWPTCWCGMGTWWVEISAPPRLMDFSTVWCGHNYSAILSEAKDSKPPASTERAFLAAAGVFGFFGLRPQNDGEEGECSPDREGYSSGEQ